MIDINIYIESREKPEERLEEFASGDLWQQKTPLLRGVLYSLAGVTRKLGLRPTKDILTQFFTVVTHQNCGDLWQQKTPLSLVKQVVDATGNDPAKLRSQSQSAHHAPHPTTMWSLMDTAYLKCSNCKIGYLI